MERSEVREKARRRSEVGSREGKNFSLSHKGKKKNAKRRGIVASSLSFFHLFSTSFDLFLLLSLAGRGVEMAAAALPRRIIKETQRFLTDKGAMGESIAKRVFFSLSSRRDAISPSLAFSRPFSPSLTHLSAKPPQFRASRPSPTNKICATSRWRLTGLQTRRMKVIFFTPFQPLRPTTTNDDDGGKEKKRWLSTFFSFSLFFRTQNNQAASSNSSSSSRKTTRWRHQR